MSKHFLWKKHASEWKRLYEDEGWTVMDIARDHSVNPDDLGRNTIVTALMAVGTQMGGLSRSGNHRKGGNKASLRATQPHLSKADSDVRKAEMRELRAGGWTLQAIADKYGVTRAYVSQVVGPGRPDSRALVPVTRVCERCGFETTNIRAHWKAERHHPNYTIERRELDEDIVRRYQGGERTYDISRECGVTYPQIYRTLHRYGITPDRGGGSYVRDAKQRARMSYSHRERWKRIKAGGPSKLAANNVRNWRASDTFRPL